MNVTVQIDPSGLNRGIAAASRVSRRSMPQLVNTAAYWVAVNAKAGMPFVTPERVDKELSVITQPVIGKRGKPLKTKKQYAGAAQANGGAPLAALIIQARAKPGSRYNQLTAARYALTASPFKGVSREAGRRAMAHLVDAMIKARHKSGKFLLAGWIPVIQRLAPYAVQKYSRGGASPRDNAKAFYGAELGAAKPATEGLQCYATIENDVGLKGKNRASMNRALNQYGAGPFQDALDREGRQTMEHALKKMEAEVAVAANRHWS